MGLSTFPQVTCWARGWAAPPTSAVTALWRRRPEASPPKVGAQRRPGGTAPGGGRPCLGRLTVRSPNTETLLLRDLGPSMAPEDQYRRLVSALSEAGTFEDPQRLYHLGLPNHGMCFSPVHPACWALPAPERSGPGGLAADSEAEVGCRSLASGPQGGQGGMTVLLCPKPPLVWGDLGGSPPRVPPPPHVALPLPSSPERGRPVTPTG